MSDGVAFPLFLRLSEKSVLVVGMGPVGLDKARTLLDAGARVRSVDPAVTEVPQGIRHERGAFEERDLDDAWLVIAAADAATNRTLKRACDARHKFVVAIDDIESCSAFGAAVVRRGPLTLAISSDGKAPALVAVLRRALEALLPADDVERWGELATSLRAEWKASAVPLARRRPLLIEALTKLYPEGVT